MNKTNYTNLCSNRTQMLKVVKGEVVSSTIHPITSYKDLVDLTKQKMFNCDIMTENIFVVIFPKNSADIVLVHIAMGYQTIILHPHISFDVCFFAEKYKAENIVLITNPIGSFLPLPIKLITGQIIFDCRKIGVNVYDHLLFKSMSNQIVSLKEDGMLDYCQTRYLEQIQLEQEK